MWEFHSLRRSSLSLGLRGNPLGKCTCQAVRERGSGALLYLTSLSLYAKNWTRVASRQCCIGSRFWPSFHIWNVSFWDPEIDSQSSYYLCWGWLVVHKLQCTVSFLLKWGPRYGVKVALLLSMDLAQINCPEMLKWQKKNLNKRPTNSSNLKPAFNESLFLFFPFPERRLQFYLGFCVPPNHEWVIYSSPDVRLGVKLKDGIPQCGIQAAQNGYHCHMYWISLHCASFLHKSQLILS